MSLYTGRLYFIFVIDSYNSFLFAISIVQTENFLPNFFTTTSTSLHILMWKILNDISIGFCQPNCHCFSNAVGTIGYEFFFPEKLKIDLIALKIY